MSSVLRCHAHHTRGLTLAQKLDFYSMPEPNSGCQLWLGAHTKRMGYGTIFWEEQIVPAHKASWESINGPVPMGLLVLHKCDNPACINPNHLFLGTHKDNSDDKIEKGRRPSFDGTRNGRNKLSEADVLAIRHSSETSGPLKKRYGVSATVINHIKRGKLWGNLR